MENLGSLAILLAFCVSIYAAVASVVGRIKRKPFLIVSGARAVYSVWLLVGRAGRFAAVLELPPCHLRLGGCLHQPPPSSRHDAVGGRRAGLCSDLLP